MINLNRMVEIPFAPKEVKDVDLAKFIADHIAKCKTHPSCRSGKFIKDLEMELGKYLKLLSEIKDFQKKRKSNTKRLVLENGRYKDFLRSLANFLAFTYSKTSTEFLKVFPNGLTEIASLKPDVLMILDQRITNFFLSHQNDEVFKKLQRMHMEISDSLQACLELQMSYHDELSRLTKEKNELKLVLIKYFKRNVFSFFIENVDSKKAIGGLFDQKIISKRLSDTK